MIPHGYLKSLKIAAETAMEAHKGQCRKYNDAPYVVHPARVAQLVILYDNTEYLGAITAWMHDILEDCGYKGECLVTEALYNMPLKPEQKTDLLLSIQALTKDDNIHPRQAKWDDCILRIINKDTPSFTTLVKICDRIDNLMDMEGFSNEFLKMYLKETEQFITTLRSGYLHTIYEENALHELSEIVRMKYFMLDN